MVKMEICFRGERKEIIESMEKELRILKNEEKRLGR